MSVLMFWMLCISVSESPPFVASWKQTQTTECLPQGSGQRIKKARPSHLRSHLELRTLIPAISTKTLAACLSRPLFLNHRARSMAGKIVMKLLFKRTWFKWDAPLSPPQPLCCQTFESQNHPIWVPTLLILNVSEKGNREPGHVWHC